MKNYTALLYILIFVFQGIAQAQKMMVPAKVKTAFTQKFENAERVKWSKESATEWEAEFEIDGKKYSANFTADGAWKETEYEIEFDELPKDVQETLNSSYNGYNILKLQISESSNGIFTEVVVEQDGEEWEIIIDPKGTIIKKSEMESEDGDENDDEDIN